MSSDNTNNKDGKAKKQDIKREPNLSEKMGNLSIGPSSSQQPRQELRKPLKRDEVPSDLSDMDIKDLPGIGPKYGSVLKEKGITVQMLYDVYIKLSRNRQAFIDHCANTYQLSKSNSYWGDETFQFFDKYFMNKTPKINLNK